MITMKLMICSMLITIASSLVLPQDGEHIWAVLIAGSYSYSNYRHQADICHAYQVLHDHGVPDEQIIVMMMNDIAYNPSNPTPGIILNSPTGPDVYQGVPKDYTGMDVNIENFVNIMLGNETAMRGIGTGKVLKSGPNDHVFLNYVDHGGPGYLNFQDEILYVTNFTEIIVHMHQNNAFGKMAIYIEACEAGSMVDWLPPDMDTYALTAVGPFRQSMSCCYDIERQTTLGDLFSVNWLEDSDSQNIQIETLDTQFAIVRQETTMSLVHQYGDLNIGWLPVGAFQGMKLSNKSLEKSTVNTDIVPAREVPLYTLRKRLEYAATPDEAKQIQEDIDKLIANRAFMQNTVEEIIRKAVKNDVNVDQILKSKRRIQNHECYFHVLKYFNNKCFNISKNEYSSTYTHTLVNMCETGIPATTIQEAMDEVCIFAPVTGIN